MSNPNFSVHACSSTLDVHRAGMERIQYRALKCIYNDFDSSCDKLLTRAKLPILSQEGNLGRGLQGC